MGYWGGHQDTWGGPGGHVGPTGFVVGHQGFPHSPAIPAGLHFEALLATLLAETSPRVALGELIKWTTTDAAAARNPHWFTGAEKDAHRFVLHLNTPLSPQNLQRGIQGVPAGLWWVSPLSHPTPSLHTLLHLHASLLLVTFFPFWQKNLKQS